jgi:haloalkane dehalogenase
LVIDAPHLPGWIERRFPAGLKRRLVDVGGVRMHVASWPAAGPTVVLLHGNPSWSFLWRKVVAELAGDGFNLIAPDLIGLGLSDKPRDPAAHQLSAHGVWLGSLLDELAPGPLYFVGQDWGGPIGLHALATRLPRLRGLVLANTVIGPPRPGFKPTGFHRFARLPVVSDLVFRGLGFPQIAMTAVQGDRTSLVGRDALAYWWPLRHLRDRAAPLALARMVPDSPDHVSIPALERCLAAAKRFAGPTALVWGTRDPILGTVINHLERELPAADVTRTDAGHFLQEEVPGPIADAIRRVVARGEAAALTG